MDNPRDSGDPDSQQRDDRHGDQPDHGADVSIVPAIVNEFGDDLHPGSRPKGMHQEITLQRLPPNSSWEDIVFSASRVFEEANVSPPRARRPSLVTIVLIAAIIGALSGAGTTWGVGHFGKDDKAKVADAARERSINDAIAQVSSELQTLKSSAEATAKDNAARLARLSETLGKMKASPPDITGSIPAPAAQVASPAPAVTAPATTFSRLPTLEGWTLRDVTNGGAMIEGRLGVFEVYPGDPLPGVGRVNAIRRQDGRWVVVTERGLITTR
ncbi:MAG: hypothetical protein K2W78_07000 [Xanthobacteraceae bacterium]|nr:hypothetical protein [Xanthobacteraceae bacterium]